MHVCRQTRRNGAIIHVINKGYAEGCPLSMRRSIRRRFQTLISRMEEGFTFSVKHLEVESVRKHPAFSIISCFSAVERRRLDGSNKGIYFGIKF